MIVGQKVVIDGTVAGTVVAWLMNASAVAYAVVIGDDGRVRSVAVGRLQVAKGVYDEVE